MQSRLILTEASTYYSTGEYKTLQAGEYAVDELPHAARILARTVDGLRSYLIFPDGTTKPRVCANPRYDHMRALIELVNTNFTPSLTLVGAMWTAKGAA